MVENEFDRNGDTGKGNPYSAPVESSGLNSNTLSSLLWPAVLTIVGSMILVSTLGACLGMLIGLVSPSYYEMTFPKVAGNPSFSPVRLGFALGATQGAGLGALIGSVAVFAVAFYRSRVIKPKTSVSKAE